MTTILCLNSGSSSLKFALFEARTPGDEELPEPLLSGVIEATRDGPRCTLTTAEGASETLRPDITAGKVDEEVRWLLGLLRERKETTTPPAVVAHRIVHGGTRYTEAVAVTPEVLSDLDALTPFAPLHQPPGLQGIRTATALLPEALQVACFDTAFHAGHPEVEARYPLPRVWYEEGTGGTGFTGFPTRPSPGGSPDFSASGRAGGS